MRRGIAAVALKEFRHMLHDRLTLTLTFGLPVLQLLLYGYALETRILHVPAALLNHDSHQAGRLLAERIAQSPLFTLETSYRSEKQMRSALQRGAIRAAIEIPPDYTANLIFGRKATLRVWVDGADAATSNFLLAALDSLGSEASLDQIALQPGVAIESHILSNASGSTVAFLIPGLIAILLQTIVTLLVALSFASERESGTLEQMLTTPLGPNAIIAGKASAIAAIGLAESAALVFLMRYIFAIPIEGSVWLLISMLPLLVLTPIGLGLLIASRARNHSHALQLANLVLLPSILLSGFVFPREFLKFPFNEISRLLPCTYLVSLSRDIVLRGTPAADIAPQLVISTCFACLLTVAGFLALRRSLAVR
jgi:ABC-2 type transport system permease protein